jgi:hypothetical protein
VARQFDPTIPHLLGGFTCLQNVDDLQDPRWLGPAAPSLSRFENGQFLVVRRPDNALRLIARSFCMPVVDR